MSADMVLIFRATGVYKVLLSIVLAVIVSPALQGCTVETIESGIGAKPDKPDQPDAEALVVDESPDECQDQSKEKEGSRMWYNCVINAHMKKCVKTCEDDTDVKSSCDSTFDNYDAFKMSSCGKCLKTNCLGDLRKKAAVGSNQQACEEATSESQSVWEEGTFVIGTDDVQYGTAKEQWDQLNLDCDRSSENPDCLAKWSTQINTAMAPFMRHPCLFSDN